MISCPELSDLARKPRHDALLGALQGLREVMRPASRSAVCTSAGSASKKVLLTAMPPKYIEPKPTRASFGATS